MKADGYPGEDCDLGHEGRWRSPRGGFQRSLLEPVLAITRVPSPPIDAPRATLGAPIDSSAAMRELLTVHRIEQARLLLQASRLRCESTRLGRSFLALCVPERAESDWRREADEELDACLLDGWDVPESLVECVSRSRVAWSSARALARAAFMLEPSAATRIQMARAELCEGSIEAALRMLEDLRAIALTRQRGDELLETLALASEAGGCWQMASAHYVALRARTDTNPSAEAALLALALRAGDIRGAEEVRARLIEADASAGEDDLLATHALPRLRARIQFHRRAARWQYGCAAQRWIHEWMAQSGRAAAVALAVL